MTRTKTKHFLDAAHYVIAEKEGKRHFHYAVWALERRPTGLPTDRKLFSTRCEGTTYDVAVEHAREELRVYYAKKDGTATVAEGRIPYEQQLDRVEGVLTDEERKLVDENAIIPAIKAIRERVGCTLRAAKLAVDEHRDANSRPMPAPSVTLINPLSQTAPMTSIILPACPPEYDRTAAYSRRFRAAAEVTARVTVKGVLIEESMPGTDPKIAIDALEALLLEAIADLRALRAEVAP